MTKSRTTRKALVSSALAVLLCMAMLIGTTFAWFTDTASTAVNKIQAGELKVDIVDKDGNSLEGKQLSFKNVDGETDILWEPGATFTLDSFKIVNNGNLALKYQVIISGVDGSAKLLDAIEFTMKKGDGEAEAVEGWEDVLLPAGEISDEYAVGETDLITITGKMKENAGNEYQGLSIDGISITVVAKQFTYEKDSIDDQYDKDATYLNTDADGNILIGSAGDLRYFAATVNADNSVYAGKTIKLTSDIDLGGAEWAPINWQNRTGFTFDGNGKTISNFTVTTKLGERNSGFFSYADMTTIKNLTISGATVTGTNHVGALVGGAYCNTIENCTVKDSSITAVTWWDPAENNGKGGWNDGDKVGALAGYLDENTVNVTGCTVTGCTVKGYRDVGGLIGYLGMKDNTITGNTVSYTTITHDNTHNYKSYTSETEYDVNELIGEINAGTSVNTINDNDTATNVTVIR